MRRAYISSRLSGLCLFLAVASLGYAQIQIPPLPEGPPDPPKLLDHYPEKPSLPISFSIPVAPLGFAVPGDHYLLRKQSLVSLDFLAEDRLLFTFRVPGLIGRNGDDDPGGEKQQQIRALVLSLPEGKIESQADWLVPDRFRYLWMLNDGRFLLRARNGLNQGDRDLRTTAYLPADRLLWIQMDPQQQLLITNSLEPAKVREDPRGPNGSSAKNEVGAAAVSSRNPGEHRILVARTLKRSSGEVIRVSRVPWSFQTSDWPMNSEGYVERSKQSGTQWLLNLSYFAGGNRELAHIDSTCPPKYDFVSEAALLISACDPETGWKLSMISVEGKVRWQVKAGTNAIWPKLVPARTGSYVARATLLLKRSANRYKRLLSARDLRGQMVKVFDAENGRVVLEAPLTPVLDGGGNVAISPSGQRAAILNAGAIQVFELPALPTRVALGVTQ